MRRSEDGAETTGTQAQRKRINMHLHLRGHYHHYRAVQPNDTPAPRLDHRYNYQRPTREAQRSETQGKCCLPFISVERYLAGSGKGLHGPRSVEHDHDVRQLFRKNKTNQAGDRVRTHRKRRLALVDHLCVVHPPAKPVPHARPTQNPRARNEGRYTSFHEVGQDATKQNKKIKYQNTGRPHDPNLPRVRAYAVAAPLQLVPTQ